MRSLTAILAVSLIFIAMQTHARAYYVDPVNGSDSNNGASVAAAFKTLQKGANSTHPGDTVYAMAGTYADTADSAVLNISISGTSAHPITYTNYKGQLAKIQLNNNNWQGINIAANTQYIVINGFEIEGTNQSLTWSGANKARLSGVGNPMYNGTGVVCNGGVSGKTVRPVSHVTIQNCRVHDCAEAGIGTAHSDWVTIRNNTIWNCCWYSPYNSSGISMWEDADSNSNTTDSKMIIQANKLYNNRDYIGAYPAPMLQWSITDGNGIIIDDADCPDTGIAYRGKTLVADNLVYDSGGAEIRAFNSNNVDAVNNTLYHNAQCRSTAKTHISAGGPAVSPFAADVNFSGGSTATNWTGAVDTTLVTKVTPAPRAVYQSERHGVAGGFTYTIPATALCSYHIVLHFTEDTWNAANKRQFNVAINGNPWLTNYDIYAAAGAMHKAVAKDCRDTSDPNGNITIAFTVGKYDVPKVDGIEILPDSWSQASELDVNSDVNFNYKNNIICPIPGYPATTRWNSASAGADYNLYYDGTSSHPVTAFTDNHASWTDPLFVEPGITGTANFHLQTGSPAVDSGTSSLAPANDLDGVARPQGRGYDLGCYVRSPRR